MSSNNAKIKQFVNSKRFKFQLVDVNNIIVFGARKIGNNP